MSISEVDFSTQIEDLFRQFGWRFMHMKPAVMQSGKWASNMNPEGNGFPDYVAVHKLYKRLLFVELKSAEGRMRPEQTGWLDDLRECVLWITTEPVWVGRKPQKLSKKARMKESFEVYVWRPDDFDKILELLR